MSSLNKVQLIGHLGADAESRSTDGGTTITNFRLATTESWKDKQSGEKQERTEWHRIVIFGKLAADTARSKIVCVIAHASIFPVNEIVLVVFIDKEIEVKEVIVTKAFWRIVGLDKVLQFIDFGGHFPVAWNVDRAFFQKK